MTPRIALVVLVALVACSSSPPAPETPAITTPVHDAAPPDADVPPAVEAAAPWVFRYRTAQRAEVWTLRTADGAALLIVETAQGTTRYVGTATDGASLALEVSTSTAKLALDCKRAKRPLGTACNDATAAPVDVLDCYHPDFAAPMPFGPAPGVEYVVDDTCNGYRLAAP